MKVACLFLTLDRHELSIRCIQQNLFNAGVGADVFWIDNGSTPEAIAAIEATGYPFTAKRHFPENVGISSAINAGLELAHEEGELAYDAIVTLANDILMPPRWLEKMVEFAEKVPQSGMIGIHCVEGLPPLTEKGVHEIFTPFGNVMITGEALKAAGKFNTDYDPYGMQDADYAYRLNKLGFVSYYLPGLTSEHIGADMGTETEYRAMKNAGLEKAGDVWTAAIFEYDSTGNYKL